MSCYSVQLIIAHGPIKIIKNSCLKQGHCPYLKFSSSAMSIISSKTRVFPIPPSPSIITNRLFPLIRSSSLLMARRSRLISSTSSARPEEYHSLKKLKGTTIMTNLTHLALSRFHIRILSPQFLYFFFTLLTLVIYKICFSRIFIKRAKIPLNW